MKIRNSILIVLLMLGISCKDSNQQQKPDNNFQRNNTSRNEVEIKSLFPDTVHRNEKYSGFIIYESPFDSITENMFGNEYNRRVVLELNSEPYYSADKDFYIDSLSIYRFIAVDNRKMPYYQVSFSEIGVFELEGKLEDSYLLMNNYPDSISEISSLLEFTKKIVVIE